MCGYDAEMWQRWRDLHFEWLMVPLADLIGVLIGYASTGLYGPLEGAVAGLLLGVLARFNFASAR